MNTPDATTYPPIWEVEVAQDYIAGGDYNPAPRTAYRTHLFYSEEGARKFVATHTNPERWGKPPRFFGPRRATVNL